MAKKNDDGGRGSGMIFTALGVELIGLCGGGYYFGGIIDEKMGYKNVVSTYLVLALMLGWFVHLIWMLKQFEKNNNDVEPPQS